MIPVTIDPRFFSRIWPVQVAERFEVPVDVVKEFLLGVVLATVETATGSVVGCDVTFGLDQVVDGGNEFADTVLMAVARFTIPRLTGLRAGIAQQERRNRAESLFRQAMRIQCAAAADSRFRCLVQWRAIDRYDLNVNEVESSR